MPDYLPTTPLGIALEAIALFTLTLLVVLAFPV
jgi:hypothetical protein